MKIVKLTAENFKRLVAVEITPEGNTILITGKNEASKSSVLDAIMSAMCGKKCDPPKPIREGQDHAEVTVETENFVVKRTWNSKGGGSLTVKNADGIAAKSPQALLDKIVGKIAFDPLKFIECEPRQQRQILMDLIGVSFNDIDAEYVKCQSERSQINSNKTLLQQKHDAIFVPDDTPEEEVSISNLSKKLQAVNDFNNVQGERRTHLDLLAADCIRYDEAIEGHQDNIEKYRRLMDGAATAQEICIAKRDELLAEKATIEGTILPIGDISPIQEQIEAAETINRNVHFAQNKKELAEAIDKKSNEYVDLGHRMKELEKEKATRLSKVKMPIDGLAVSEDGVLYHGLPLKGNVNDAKRLEIGVAISMALNPKLRVIRMKGNDLDSGSLAAIEKMVKDKDYQAWIEKVDESGEVGIVIEEGQVKK